MRCFFCVWGWQLYEVLLPRQRVEVPNLHPVVVGQLREPTDHLEDLSIDSIWDVLRGVEESQMLVARNEGALPAAAEGLPDQALGDANEST